MPMLSARIPAGIPIKVWDKLIIAYTIGIIFSSIPIEDVFNKTKEKLNAPNPNIPETTRKKPKGLFSFINNLILEKNVVLIFDFF